MSQHPYTAFSDQVLRRVDQLLAGKDAGVLTDVFAREALTCLRGHIGKENAISRSQLAELLDLPDRTVRDIISELRRTYAIAIGVDRSEGGYYLATSTEEMRELTAPLFHQAFSLLRTARALSGRHATAEWMGQTRIDLKLDEEDERAAA